MVGTSGETVYSATKAGVVALAKSLAREFARFGVRVNVVAPGITDTPLLESQGGESLLTSIVRQVPLRRAGRPEEIAAAIAFLASDEASYVTGALWLVDGGTTIAKGPVGDEVPDALRRAPEPHLHLEHSLEGNKNKGTHQVR